MTFKVDHVKIKRWREERHWSQEQLADLAGIGLRTIQRVENGEGASQESLKAIAAAYNVEVMALTVDPDETAKKIIHEKNEKARSAVRISFWIHLASYLMGMLIFVGIGIASGYMATMLVPGIWWTVGLAGHAVTVVIVEVTTRHVDRFGKDG